MHFFRAAMLCWHSLACSMLGVPMPKRDMHHHCSSISAVPKPPCPAFHPDTYTVDAVKDL